VKETGLQGVKETMNKRIHCTECGASAKYSGNIWRLGSWYAKYFCPVCENTHYVRLNKKERLHMAKIKPKKTENKRWKRLKNRKLY